jgi:hypothetical protein
MLHHEVMCSRDFGVKIRMNRWETTSRYNLAETCAESITALLRYRADPRSESPCLRLLAAGMAT